MPLVTVVSLCWMQDVEIPFGKGGVGEKGGGWAVGGVTPTLNLEQASK